MNAARLIVTPEAAKIINLADARLMRGLDKYRRNVGVGAMPRRFATGQGGYNVASEGAFRENCNVTTKRRKFLNFRATVLAGAQANILQTPQERMQITCLSVPSSIGTAFTIDDVIIGTHTQNVAPGTGALAQIFSEVAVASCAYLFDVICDVGIQVRLLVTNVTAETQEFFATCVGCTTDLCQG